jgi:hypothetical protein
MKLGYYREMKAVDAQGRNYHVVHDESNPNVPVGWVEAQLSPGEECSVTGLPIRLGEGKFDGAEATIDVRPGDAVRLSFEFSDSDLERGGMQRTGEVAFKMTGAAPESDPARYDDSSGRERPPYTY